jgi:hypothetical protein
MRPSITLAILLAISACKPVNQPEPVPAQFTVVASPTPASTSPISISKAALLAEQYIKDNNLSDQFAINEIAVARGRDKTPLRYTVFLRTLTPAPEGAPTPRPTAVLYISFEGEIRQSEITIRPRQQ